MMMNDGRGDNVLRDRLAELAARAVERGSVEYTRFLDPREQNMARDASKKAGATFGLYGQEGMERRVCSFDGRLWLDEDERTVDWPVAALEILWEGRYARLAHRDLLGALLALGIGRESLGDIRVEEGRAVLWALENIALFIVQNLASAGRAAVKVSILPGGEGGPVGEQTRHVRGSVQSLRLDAVVAEAFDLSREEAVRAVAAGLVKLDYEPQAKPDRKVQEGALISVRGRGRALLIKASDHTRRSGRTVVEFERTV